MINADDALRIILEAVRPLGSELVSLTEALGRTMARDVPANLDLPPFDNSSMDGYAVRSEDVRSASPDAPVRLNLVGESSAGRAYKGSLKASQTIRIMTGGKVPRGADAVVPLEQAGGEEEGRVLITGNAQPGGSIRKSGEDIHSGDVALRAGEVIGPGQIGLSAALGWKTLRVARKPVVSILATGNELVESGARPADGQIRNSTSHALAGLVLQSGGLAKRLGIARDDRLQITRGVMKGMNADVLLVTGGVSVGKYDLVKDVLKAKGVQVKFWKVNIKPGMPLFFGVRRGTLVFGLPGNPVSTAVTFLQFVRPAIHALMGRTEVSPLRLPAVIDQAYKKTDGKRHFVRGVVRTWGSHMHVRITGTQSSGATSSLAKANCLIIIPEEVNTLNPGDPVEIELL